MDFGYDDRSYLTQVKRWADLLGTEQVVQSDYTYDFAGRLTGLPSAGRIMERVGTPALPVWPAP